MCDQMDAVSPIRDEGLENRRRALTQRLCGVPSVDRNRRIGQGAGGEGHQGPVAVVAGDAVGLEAPAGTAAMDDGPFAIVFDPDGDGLHEPAAGRGPVAGGFVDVTGPQAVWAMVAMAGAERGCVNGAAAVAAGECRRAALVAAVGATVLCVVLQGEILESMRLRSW